MQEEMEKLKSKVEAANALVLMELTTEAKSDKTVLVISDEEKNIWNQQQQQKGYSSPSSPRTWLALSTPTSSINIKRV
ncbi:hypothetical protein V6N12_067957 [Hibiscus sabdariffa]|uniref:Uncharacterized protein n=1 Tax=Hibiscus sabdariffa TaxID=183260 RepID=A0ABR2FNM1_9ROSI